MCEIPASWLAIKHIRAEPMMEANNSRILGCNLKPLAVAGHSRVEVSLKRSRVKSIGLLKFAMDEGITLPFLVITRSGDTPYGFIGEILIWHQITLRSQLFQFTLPNEARLLLLLMYCGWGCNSCFRYCNCNCNFNRNTVQEWYRSCIQ